MEAAWLPGAPSGSLSLPGLVQLCGPLATSWRVTADFWTPDSVTVGLLFATPVFERSWSWALSGRGYVKTEGGEQ